MPSLKEVRNKIVSVSSTMQITSAMKMVSAAKLKRAQDAVIQMRPYAQRLKAIMENASAGMDANENQYIRKPKQGPVLIIPISSNRGLAGAFNANIIKKTHALIRETFSGREITVLPIGKKVNDAFRKTRFVISGQDLPHHNNELIDRLNYSKTSAFAQRVINVFLSKQFDEVVLVYNQFKNAAVQLTVNETLLPFDIKTSGEKSNSVNADYIFEPDPAYLIQELIPRALKTQLYKALLDSQASEHGARMTAMHKATDNAKSMLTELKISYNKARQASITKEILEIVGGAEALNG
jgi:F-type H+-transporting ATPase subunit gamma